MKFILEFEGFHFRHKFIFKEIVVHCLDTGEFKHYFLKPPTSFSQLSEQNQSIVRFCENNLHKIFWNSGHNRLNEVKLDLRSISIPENTILIKGEQKVEVAKQQLGINCPIIEVTEVIDKKLADFRIGVLDFACQKTITCPLRFHLRTRHCATIKAAFIATVVSEAENEPLPSQE